MDGVPKKGSQEYDEVIAIMKMGYMEKHEEQKKLLGN